MLYRLSYASVLRREIVYYNPESSRCKAFPYATESTRVSEATVSAPPARQLNVSNHTASRSVRARVWTGKSGQGVFSLGVGRQALRRRLEPFAAGLSSRSVTRCGASGPLLRSSGIWPRAASGRPPHPVPPGLNDHERSLEFVLGVEFEHPAQLRMGGLKR
jgi:hypothetical protein